jgi:biotin carboxylase
MTGVVLYSRNPALGLKVLYCLSHAGARVHVIAAKAGSYLRQSRYCRAFEAIEEPDADRHRHLLAERIDALARERPIDAVLGDDIGSHALLHDIAADISPPAFAPSSGALLADCHDKWAFYSRLLEHGLPVPPSVRLASLADLTEENASAVGFPLLVKPLNAESGHGIRRFDDFGTLRHYLTTQGPYKALPLKLQRLIAGPTLGLSLLARGGEILCHDVQRHADDGSRVFDSNPEVLDIGRRIVALFGYGGPGHIDFVQDAATGRLYALEFNCRYWYSLTVSLWRGGNFPALAVDLARGRPVPASPTRPGAYFQPGAVISLAKRPWRLARLDAANWRGFCQAVSDPLPHLASRLRR